MIGVDNAVEVSRERTKRGMLFFRQWDSMVFIYAGEEEEEEKYISYSEAEHNIYKNSDEYIENKFIQKK